MARRPEEYLSDILASVSAIRTYTRSGRLEFFRNAMVRDAVIARILQIGEAVKGAQASGIDWEKLAPEVPWQDIAGMRDVLSHQYWRTDPQIVWDVVAKDLKALQASVRKIHSGRARAPRK